MKKCRITTVSKLTGESFKVEVHYKVVWGGPNRYELQIKIPEDQELPEDLKVRELSVEKVYSPGSFGTAGITVTGLSHNKLYTELDADFFGKVESRITMGDEELKNWKTNAR